MSFYLVLPHLEINSANAQPVWWIIGPPPITAYLGFAHAMALRLEAKSHEGVAVIHHDIQMLGESFYDYGVNTLLPHQFRAASLVDESDYVDKKKPTLSSQPTARCNLRVSLIIRLPADTRIDLSAVEGRLRGGRVAGGSIVAHGKPYLVSDSEADDKNLLAGIGSGFSIVSRQDLMVRTDADRDMLDVVLRVTRQPSRASLMKVVQPGESEPTAAAHNPRVSMPETDSRAWLMPTTIGYAEITPRVPRRNVRGDNLHAFAEPLVSLVQYRPSRTAGLHFWRYTQPESNLFVAITD